MDLHLVSCFFSSPTPKITQGMAKLAVNEEVGHGTIKAAATCDPETDAGVLRKAMKGLGNCRGGAWVWPRRGCGMPERIVMWVWPGKVGHGCGSARGWGMEL